MENTQNERQILANESDDVSEAQEEQPNYFDILPDELHLEILKNVSPLELDSVASVCSRFNRNIQDRSLWKKVVIIGPCKLEPGYVGKLMKRPVQHLTLSNLTIPLLRSTLEATQQSWCLKEVCLHNVEAKPEDLVKMFNKCKQLTKVDLATIYVNDDVFVALSENRNIEILRLRTFQGLTKQAFDIFLQNASKLQEFYIETRSPTEPRPYQVMLDVFCENLPPTLTHITFTGYYFDSITGWHIEHIERNCPLLQSLRLTKFQCFTLSGRSTESLRNLKHLRVLKVPVQTVFDLLDLLAVTTQMESLVELGIESYYRSSPNLREVEELFGVTMIEEKKFCRVGTFTTNFGVVKITY